MTEHILPPREFVLIAVATYPTLYSSLTYDEVATKVFDQLFNVNGNGIRGDEELIKTLTAAPVKEADALKWIGAEPVWYGYTKCKELGHNLNFPDMNSHYPGYYLEAEKKDHPSVVYWINSTVHFPVT